MMMATDDAPDTDAILVKAQERMKKAQAATASDLATLRSGRANPSLLDRIHVEYYGSLSPLNQMANISVKEGTSIVIQPYDKTSLPAIEKAIAKSDLNLTPNTDGEVLRINVPALSQDRRKELCKLAHKMGEEGKVAIRNIRRDANDELNKLKKEISEDEIKGQQEALQKHTDAAIKGIDALVADKEQDILQV